MMGTINFFEHFKTILFTEFQFLKEFGFSDFQEEQHAYEYHFITKNKHHIEIDFQIEMISSTPIWITINGIHLENLLGTHSFFKDYKAKLEGIYKETSNSKNVTSNQSIFKEEGFLLNEKYLNFVKTLFIKNPEYLKDVSIYDKLNEIQKKQRTLELEDYLKDFKKLFTMDGQLLVTEVALKEQFEKCVLVFETDKISIEFSSYNEFVEFINTHFMRNIDFENIMYKFQLK